MSLEDDSAERAGDAFYDLLNQIAVALGSIRDRNTLASAMKILVDECFAVEFSGLFYWDPKLQTLRFAYASGFSEEERAELERSAMSRLPGQVFRDKQTIMVPDVEAHHDRIIAKSHDRRVQSRLHAPVLYRNESVGVLALASSKKFHFNHAKMRLASFIAQMAGVVYGNLLHLDELDNQLNTIRTQREEILHLSAPVLNLGRGMLLLPLIGQLTPEKAAHAQEHALHAIVKYRAKTAIIDLTGVAAVDAETARLLLSLAGTVRLLGARCFISGLAPKTASCMVDIGFEGGRIHFFSSVAAAMNAAQAFI